LQATLWSRVISSRRLDGLCNRPFIAHISENGVVGKPFLLSQSTSNFYPNLLELFNIPEFVSGKVEVDPGLIEDLVAGENGKPVDALKMQ
jgi:hypothetical protein